MPKRRGDSHAIVQSRKQRVWTLFLRRASTQEIAEKTGLGIRAVQLMVQSVKEDLHATMRASELYSLKQAFAELDQLCQEAWGLYSRSAPKIVTKKGIIEVDDRAIKATLLRELRGLVFERARLCGYFSPKVMEKITLIETATARGIRIERIPFDEQLKNGVEELKNNEGLARSEGITDQTVIEGRLV